MLKKIKGVTPGMRNRVYRKNTEGSIKVPTYLRKGRKKKGGRNNTGKITVRHRGGGYKRRLRKVIGISHKLSAWEGKVVGIQYDPNRTGRLALTLNSDGKYGYILAGKTVSLGDILKYTSSVVKGERKEGNIYTLGNIPIGKEVSNLEAKPGKGCKYIRSAGGKGILLRKIDGYGLVRIPSGKLLNLDLNVICIYGGVMGEEHKMENRGKAGRSRNLGIRPTVRGEAMNPIDHPHGGRTRGGRLEKTPWGKLAKGFKTTKRKKKDKFKGKSGFNLSSFVIKRE